MTNRQGRNPGDPAPTDRDFGPLGGFVDDLVFSVRSQQRDRETADRHRLRAPDADRPVRPGWLARVSAQVRAMLGRVDRH